jgi:hypothetical protein
VVSLIFSDPEVLNVSGRWIGQMESRREHRFKPNQTVTVRVLGLRLWPVIQASILDVSGSGMRLRSGLPVPLGTLIEIESDHLVSKGSVCRCESEQDSYEIGIQVSETGPVSKPHAHVQAN